MLSCAEAWHDFNAAEAWVVVRSYCRVAIVAFDCGSALWADFFFKQSSWLLKIGLLLFAEAWLAFNAAEAWVIVCLSVRTAFAAVDCESALRADFFLKQSSRLLKIGLLLFAEAWHAFNAAEA